MLRIDDDHYEALVAHARAGYPNEACALLAGRDGSVERVYALPNAEAARPSTWSSQGPSCGP